MNGSTMVQSIPEAELFIKNWNNPVSFWLNEGIFFKTECSSTNNQILSHSTFDLPTRINLFLMEDKIVSCLQKNPTIPVLRIE
jgi:hypothetical protein